MVAVLEAETDAAVAGNAAEVEPAGTVTEAGTVRTALLSARVTRLPPAGAGWVKVTVQVVEPEPVRVADEQARAETPVATPDKVTVPCAPEELSRSPVNDEADVSNT